MDQLPFTLLLFFLWALASGCEPTTYESLKSSNVPNQMVKDFDGGYILLGEVNRKGLQSRPHSRWFLPAYRDYQPDPEVVSDLKPKLNGKQIIVFMANWCKETQVEIPHLYKVLDEADFSYENLSMFALSNHPNRFLQSPQGFEKGWKITSIPTIIVVQDGRELGRIVEVSTPTLEKHLQAISSR